MKLYRHAVALLLLSAPLSHGTETTNAFARKVLDKDWSSKVKQMNLRNHLTTPTAGELKSGAHNSRRLARNHIRLGIDEDHHRELVPENPPASVVKLFTAQANQGLPSTGPRLEIDDFMDSLPLGDGPGYQPGLPKGTRDFWLGNGPPTQVWEVSSLAVLRIIDTFRISPLSFVLFIFDITVNLRLWLVQFMMLNDSSVILSVAFLEMVKEQSWISFQALILTQLLMC